VPLPLSPWAARATLSWRSGTTPGPRSRPSRTSPTGVRGTTTASGSRTSMAVSRVTAASRAGPSTGRRR
ncbi:hypothetical protein BN1708_020476, partial [Verticillium longisporum]